MRLGQRVLLNVPDNPRLDGEEAVVVEVTAYGARVACAAAGSGFFRALESELVELSDAPPPARDAGYVGDPCSTCGSLRMRRNGSCLLCDDCGSTTGC